MAGSLSIIEAASSPAKADESPERAPRSRGLTAPGRHDRALRQIVDGTVAVTGKDFFRSLVRHLAGALDVRCALVTERLPGPPTRAHVIAFWDGRTFHPPFDYTVEGHPCADVYDRGFCHHAQAVRASFPSDPFLAAVEAESYLGIAMPDAEGRILGHLVVLDDRPMGADPANLDILSIFSARAGAELQRLRLERSREHLTEMIVHDLRNPLVSVIGHLELLEEGRMGAESTRDSVRLAKRSAERLVAMVTDILDVGKLESDRMPVERAPLALRAAVEDVVAEMRPVLGGKSLGLEVDVPSDAWAAADHHLTRRVLHNLLANAAAFSPRGTTISVDARAVPEVADHGPAHWRISVRDQGPGIRDADRDRIFDRFGITERRGRRHSSGLGLAFCKLAVGTQGGQIGVETESGGSVFWFTLPAAERPSPEAVC